jgi:hypothetical protein
MGKGVNRFFCDVHRRARNGEGYRITFTADGVTFKHVDGFGDIPQNPVTRYTSIHYHYNIPMVR